MVDTERSPPLCRLASSVCSASLSRNLTLQGTRTRSVGSMERRQHEHAWGGYYLPPALHIPPDLMGYLFL